MDTAATILIAIGLAMDAFAVSISGGVGMREGGHRWPLIAGALFGGFQAGMPVLGWLGGTAVAGVLGFYGPRVAFLLLVLIGGKMILEAVRGDGENAQFANLSAAPSCCLPSRQASMRLLSVSRSPCWTPLSSGPQPSSGS